MQRRSRGHEEGWLLSYADLITNLLLFFVVLLTAANLSKGKMQQITKAISGEEQPESLASIKESIDEEIKKRQLENVVETKLEDEGLEVALNSGLIFGSGQALIQSDFEEVLSSMLKLIAPYSKNYSFAVEGHTDSTPIAKGGLFPSNWELSTARAIVVRERLEKTGIERKRIRVEGYADTVSLPEEELKGLNEAERKARHRRVVVRVY